MTNARGIRIFLLSMVFLVITSNQTIAQDIHFSSVSFNPMFQNPAATGFMTNKLRVSSIYRNQWATVSRGYNTFVASIEAQPLTFSGGGLGLGLSFTNDVAGSLSYGEQDIAFNTSYFQAVNRDKTAYLGAGVGIKRESWGYNSTNASFNPEGLYDDQIRYEELNTFTLMAGLSFWYNINNDKQLHIGISAFNLNQPRLTYFEQSTDSSYLHRRYHVDASYLFPINDRFFLRPQVIINQQYRYNETIVGLDAVMTIDDGVFIDQVFSLGAYVRNLESVILCPTYKYSNFLIGLAYDVNISRLAKVSHTYGAMELWLSYAFDPIYSVKHKNTKIPCPIF